MKQAIHPTWYPNATVTCACGNTFTVGSTVPTIKVDLCSNCHPFFTGQQRLVDTLGQVDRFQVKTQKAEAAREKRAAIEVIRSQKVQEEKKDKPSLKDLLMQARKQAAN